MWLTAGDSAGPTGARDSAHAWNEYTLLASLNAPASRLRVANRKSTYVPPSNRPPDVATLLVLLPPVCVIGPTNAAPSASTDPRHPVLAVNTLFTKLTPADPPLPPYTAPPQSPTLDSNVLPETDTGPATSM